MSAARNVCIALAVAAIAAPAYAQSLAEVARKEEARRAEVKAPAKAYTNANLKPGEINNAAAEAAEEPCYMSASKKKCVTAEEMLATNTANVETAEKKKLEPYWRSKSETLRGQLEKARAELAAMTATAADKSRSAAERAVAAQRVADRRLDLDTLEKQWLKLEKDAAKMAIPHEYLEPIPEISSRPQQ
jgi:hypothetical protein